MIAQAHHCRHKGIGHLGNSSQGITVKRSATIVTRRDTYLRNVGLKVEEKKNRDRREKTDLAVGIVLIRQWKRTQIH